MTPITAALLVPICWNLNCFVRNVRKEDAYGYGDEDFAKFLLVLYLYGYQEAKERTWQQTGRTQAPTTCYERHTHPFVVQD